MSCRRAAEPCPRVRGGVERQHPFRGCARQRRKAAPCPRVCKAGGTQSEEVRIAAKRRHPAQGWTLSMAASSGATLLEGVQVGVVRRHPVRGCDMRPQAETFCSRLREVASSGGSLSEGVRDGVERRQRANDPRVCEAALSGGTLCEATPSGVVLPEDVQDGVERLHPARGCQCVRLR
jgi:hypothetical protein